MNQNYSNNDILQKITPNTKVVFIEREYDEQLPILPNTIEVLKGVQSFERKMNNPMIFPRNLIQLRLGHIYIAPFVNLPDDLLLLHLGRKFNKPIKKLPDSLITLILSKNYDKQLPELPQTLKYLRLGESYNKQLSK